MEDSTCLERLHGHPEDADEETWATAGQGLAWVSVSYGLSQHWDPGLRVSAYHGSGSFVLEQTQAKSGQVLHLQKKKGCGPRGS